MTKRPTKRLSRLHHQSDDRPAGAGAIDSGKLTKDQQITAGPTTLQDMSGNYSTANLKPGDTLTVEQLLYCLLLVSANEAADILAETVSGSREPLWS